MAAALFIVVGLFMAFNYSGQIYKAFVNEKDRTRCYGISDLEAKKLILGIFEEKLRTSKDGTILVDIRPHEIRVTRITRNQFERGDGLSSVNVFFGNKSNGTEVLEARVFEDCDVEWRPK